MKTSHFALTLVTLLSFQSVCANPSEFLACQIGDSLGALSFSTVQRPDEPNAPIKLHLSLESANDEAPADRYEMIVTRKNLKDILRGKQMVLVMESSEGDSFGFGGAMSHAAQVVFNVAGTKGATQVAEGGSVFFPRCKAIQ